MTKKEYLDAMHKLYRRVYSDYGDKDKYTLQEGEAIVESFLTEFPKAFMVDEKTFKSSIPSITARSHGLLRDNMSIDELLFGISLVALKETNTVSRFFEIKILMWSLNGSLPIAPE